MQAFREISRLEFGDGHLIAWMKVKVRDRLSNHVEATNHGELCFQSDTHVIRTDSITNIVNLAKCVEVDHCSAIENAPAEFATMLTFFLRGYHSQVVGDEYLSYYRDQLGFAETAMKGIESFAPNVTIGVHTCYISFIDYQKEQGILMRLTTRLADLAVSKEEIARWKKGPRV